MKYYLTESFSNSFYKDVLIETGGTGNLLCSYASNKNIKVALDFLKDFPKDIELIIDSGAFSVWNSGRSMNRGDLLKFYQAIKAIRPNTNFINLDVIPGSKGKKPTTKQSKDACEAGWQNFLWFKKQGFTTLPVFHEDDDWDYLYKMMKETDFICISPANDSTTTTRMKWLDKVYSILKADYKTHGLAATALPLLKRYPFYSVDSINWKSACMFAHSKSDNGNKQQVSQLSRDKKLRKVVLAREVRYYKQLQDDITNLWEKRGVKWEN